MSTTRIKTSLALRRGRGLRLLGAVLLLASVSRAKESSYRLEPPHIPAPKIVEAIPPDPQTHVFCATDTACAFTNRLSTGNLNDILVVDGTQYANIAAAVTAAGSVNRKIILIPSTYAGSECPAYQANLVLWDFRGGNIICNQINSITYNSNDASGVNSLARLIHPIQGTTLPSGGSPVAWYQETYLVNTNFNNSQADGSSADLNFFGANSGTMPLASGHELAVAFFGTASGNASTGGTVTLAAGAHGYVQTLTGSTTAVTTVAGFDGIGCAGKITGAIPVNCYGLWGRRQLGAGSSRNYGVASEGVGLFQYDSNVAKGGFDCEDNGGTVRPCLFVDATGFPGARGALNLQAVSTDGLVLQSSDGLNKITILSATTTTNKPTRFGADATPSTAAGAFLGGCGLPWAGLIIGTGASNGYSFTPASAGACRTVNILDPGATSTLALDASSTYVPATNVFTGAWICTNVTPVTVNANVTTDQNLMACTVPAGTLNRVGRTLRVKVAGIYSTPAASVSQMTVKVKICSVSGCASGNVLTALSIQSTALGTVQITNDNFSLRGELTTQTAGATLAEEAHGEYLIDLATLATAADSVFGDGNTGTQTGTPSAIDSTAQNFAQVTFAFSTASASNSATERQLVLETIN